jgi:hypothetical protein
MTVVIIRAADHRVMPWRNGQGTTREIAVHPAGATERFGWRASIATIERAGPFSAFAGYDRVIMVVDGPGMVLSVDGTEHRLDRRYVPFAFPGEATTTCAPIVGALHDFNVMTDRARYHATVTPLVVGEDGQSSNPAGETVLALCLEGCVQVEAAQHGPPIALGRWDALITERPPGRPAPGPLELWAEGGRAVVALVAIGAGPP